jgi:cyclophilin family peptidyl-prolyl cis-trans isomerase
MAMPRVELQVGQSGEDWGRIVLELDEEKAPQTVANFLRYVDDRFFDGTIFHRVIANFMIQGGGYTGDFDRKDAGLRAPIQNEAKNGLKNARGTIAMARTSDPHSATSQFFINTADNDGLDYPAHDGWGYCVFGRVVEGQDVVDRIRTTPVQVSPTGERSQPVQAGRRINCAVAGAAMRRLVFCL